MLGGYFLAGLGGNLLSLLWGPSSVSVGASGAVFGLFGMNIMILRESYRQEMKGVLFFAVIFFMLTISQNTNIFAHAGGLGVGLLVGYFWTEHFRSQPSPSSLKRRKAYKSRKRRYP